MDNNKRMSSKLSPHKYLYRSIALLIIGVGSWSFFKWSNHSSSPQLCCTSLENERTTCFTLELAQTPKKRQLWLMFRESLPDNAGMLFTFETSQRHSFRMKNTLIPLDMLRLNSDLQIVDIQQADPCEADPCPSYLPAQKAQYVLELNQWTSKKSWINIWNQCFLS
jgi:uncharacterized membrane protein (UPF0127 family)